MSDPKCFIIMPISTSERHAQERYRKDPDHFVHVLNYLFCPAVSNAGYIPIPPMTKGSDVIHADIVRKLHEADMVLCDMSTLNPNVFFEAGIRTALDKPISFVKDNSIDIVPFDTTTVNYHVYDGMLDAWTLESEKAQLTKHIVDTRSSADGRNSLWKYFEIRQVGEFKGGDATLDTKVDLLLREVDELRTLIGTAPDRIGRSSGARDKEAMLLREMKRLKLQVANPGEQKTLEIIARIEEIERQLANLLDESL